jgi:hypothetical protein
MRVSSLAAALVLTVTACSSSSPPTSPLAATPPTHVTVLPTSDVPADDQRTQVTPSLTATDAATPQASLVLSFGPGHPLAPIAGGTPVVIDAGGSRGAGLSYLIDFGDGFTTTTPVASHVVDAGGYPTLTARVTVVDSGGLRSTVTRRYNTFDLGVSGWPDPHGGIYWSGDGGHGTPKIAVSFRYHSGARYDGHMFIDTSAYLPFTGSVNGSRVQLSVPEFGAAFDGSITVGADNWFESR